MVGSRRCADLLECSRRGWRRRTRAEHAPNNARGYALPDKNFLTFFTPPVDAKTGEFMNWWRLSVRNTRFPAFAKALGWLPSPFQQFAPLRSIMTNAVEAAAERART
jgi:hypothetical protein